MIDQFSLCECYGQRVVVLTNTLFNEVEGILVAPVHKAGTDNIVQGLQIAIILNGEPHYVDLLDIATVSRRQLKPMQSLSLSTYRNEIKAGIDLLIDGF